MAFVTDAQVKTSVAAALHKASADLPSFWTDIITDANVAAYDDICGHFLDLGFTQAQVDSWDRGVTFNKFLARYQALIDGAGDQDDVGEWREELNYWRQKLTDISTLEVDDELEEPDSSGSVGHGNLSTSNDLFSLDQDDPRRGNATEW